MKTTFDQQYPSFDGTWVPVTAEFGGKFLPDAMMKTMKLVATRQEYTLESSGVKSRGTLTFHTERNPKGVDLVGNEGPNAGKTFPGIYHVHGDTLTLCYDTEGKSRPQDFNTRHGSQEFLVTFKRVR